MEENKKRVKASKDDIVFTKVAGSYGWLSNMSAYPVEFNGKKWLINEALFQAMRFDDDEVIELIRNEKSPMSAKMKAKKYRAKRIVEPMSDKDLENMRVCIKLKLEQHPTIRSRLLGTFDKYIVEDIGERCKENDFFWGSQKNDGEWIGSNMLGLIWMEFRKECRNKLNNKLKKQ